MIQQHRQHQRYLVARDHCRCRWPPGSGHRQGRQTPAWRLAGGKDPRNKSLEKLPGRHRALGTDRYLMSGHTRLAHVIGTTWVQAMCGSQSLQAKFDELTTCNPQEVTSFTKDDIIDTLKRRVDSGGMVVWNQDIYLVDPIGARCSDNIFPVAGWGRRRSPAPTATAAFASTRSLWRAGRSEARLMNHRAARQEDGLRGFRLEGPK